MDDDLITVEELSDWIGEPITNEDEGRARGAISMAFTLIDDRTGRDSDYWLENGLPKTVRNIALQVAARGFNNPDSWASEGIDDWRGGGRPVKELGLYLTETEKSLLSKFAARRSLGIGTINTTREEPADTGYQSWLEGLL